jgi:hypothetical protein
MSDTTLEKAHNALDKLGSAIHALDAIEAIAKQVGGGPAKEVFEAIHIIAVIVDTVRAGFEDKLTVKNVEDEILSLRKTILDHDIAFDLALHNKFDKG